MIKAAVLGSPIAHSLSPVIHQRAYEVLGWKWQYSKYEVASGELPDFLDKHSSEFRGLSLTMPLKEEAIFHVDSVADLAKRVNAVNTIVFDDLGSHGFNTDVQGFIDALNYRGISIPESVSILGGGATARSAIAAVDAYARRINVYSRSAHRSRALVNSAESAIVSVLPWEKALLAFEAELVIATTPRGATDFMEVPNTSAVLFESLYNPWPTPLLQRWHEADGVSLDGLELLVWQAIGQLEAMSLDGDSLAGRKEELYREMRLAALAKL